MKVVARHLTLAVAFAAVLPLAACGVVVREDGEGHEKRVDIRSPFGSVTVETNGEMAETGLPVYPGARLRHDGGDSDHANVTIGSSFFDLKVAAAKFESDDAPGAILHYYRRQMEEFGRVTECHGKLQFRRRRGVEVPVCNERHRSDDVTLGVGTSERHRMVSVRPRRDVTRFDVVLIEKRDRG